MRIELRFVALALLASVFIVLPAQAQYSEMYKLDKASNGVKDDLVLSKLSEKLAVPADTLLQQKTQHNLSFGQLYMANALAKAANKDFDAIMAQIKSNKTWGTVASENNVRMQPISTTVRDLEKILKRTKASPQKPNSD
jgi:hypothetical protein